MKRTTIMAAGVAAALALFAAACSGPDQAAYTTVDQAYAAAQANDPEALARLMEPAQQASARAGIGMLNERTNPGAPTASENTGWSVNASTDSGNTTTVTRTYTYPDRTIRVEAVMVRSESGTPPYLIRTLSITPSGPAAAPAPAAETTAAAPAIEPGEGQAAAAPETRDAAE